VDAANQQMKKYIDQGIGLIPVPYADLFGGVSKGIYEQATTTQYGKVGDWLAKQAEQGGGSAEQDAMTASDEEAVIRLLRQMSLSASIYDANGPGMRAMGEPFADKEGKILPSREWISDPEKVSRFVGWCETSEFKAPGINRDLQAMIKMSHDEAIDSFNNGKSGEMAP
jgi:hypothetical protein